LADESREFLTELFFFAAFAPRHSIVLSIAVLKAEEQVIHSIV